jgi:hypothetical protein
MDIGFPIPCIRNTFLFILINIILVGTLQSAPADGLVYWNPADKDPNIVLSNNNLDIEVSRGAPDAVGVRSNRPISQGEGFYYLEIADLYGNSHYAVGIANASAVLQGRTGIEGTASIPIYGTVPEVLAIAVDYRGAYPIVHLMADRGNGLEHLQTIPFRDEYGPVYLYISAIRHGSAVEGEPQFRLNFGDASPFFYGPNEILQVAAYYGHLGVEYGWPIDNAHPVANISANSTVALEGQSLSFSVTADDPEDGDVSSSVNWFLDGQATGSGSSITVSPEAGSHILSAVAEDSLGQPATATVTLNIDINEGLDRDNDGLLYFEELELGTNPSLRDTDSDGLYDNDEITLGTDPTDADHDNDLMPDGYEVENNLDPLVNDADLDRDGDMFSNLVEYQESRSADNINDYPGHGTVLLSSGDASGNINLQAGSLSFSISADSGVGGVRSDISIAPESGWHYFEGTRLTAAGNFGFGVATDAASLEQLGGTDSKSLGINALSGNVDFNGATVGTLTSPELIKTYGIAVDYRGITPNVHVMVKPIGADYQLLGPVTMTGVTGPLHIFAFGESQGVVQQSINAGQDTQSQPFAYSARYLLHRANFLSAQTMRNGWGTDYVYQAQATVPHEDRVFLVTDISTPPTITVSDDGLSAGYNRDVNTKSVVRANQGMKGEFRYWEGRRHRDPIDMGFGLINEYAFVDHYCCVNQGLSGGPPSMSVNSLASIWRNLDHQANFDVNANEYYGFAVDYRGDYPIVYVIMTEGVEHQMVLDDFITPIFPMLYGNNLGSAIANSTNFGTMAFQYDARQALIDEGVDVTDFVPGWGPHQQYLHLAAGTVAAPTLTYTTAPTTGVPGNALGFSATAADDEDGNLTTQIRWSNDQTVEVATGGSYNFTPATAGAYKVTAVVTDSTGQSYARSAMVTINAEPPLVNISIEQGGAATTLVTADGGIVTVRTLFTAGSGGGSYQYDWSQTDADLAPPAGTGSQMYTFNPVSTVNGFYQLDVTVTDQDSGATGHNSNPIRIVDSAPVLSDTADSDGDGVSDSDEGFADSDNDRIPDYLDPSDQPATQIPAGHNGAALETDTGVTIKLGLTAFFSGNADSSVTAEQIAVLAENGSGINRGYNFPGVINDFEAAGLDAGETVRIVVPLDSAIPASAVLHKYTTAAGWSEFVIDANNRIRSAPGALGACPAPGDAAFTEGLVEGNFCLQLSIQDGGVNDADGEANGAVQHLSGIVVRTAAPVVTVTNSTAADTTFNQNGGEQVVFAFSMTADSNDADIHELTISAAGTLNEATAVNSVTLYRDANENGLAEESEQMAAGNFTADNGQVVFTLTAPLPLPVGDTQFLVTYQ